MFWLLLCCHFLADYPLQSSAIVVAKKQTPGLILHVSIHFLTMVVVSFGVFKLDMAAVLPAILAVTVVHFGLDRLKIVLATQQPNWVFGPYLLDQVLHILTIWLAAVWFAETPFTVAAPWLIYTTSYILVTHASFVTEYMAHHRDEAYQQWTYGQLFNRVVGRAALFSLIFLGWTIWAAIGLVGIIAYYWLDLAGPYRWRAIIIDLGVAGLGIAFVSVVLR